MDSKWLVAAAVVATGLALGFAPTAHADVNGEVCLAVMATGVDPYNPSDTYARDMLGRYPDMTYNEANDLAEKSVRLGPLAQQPDVQRCHHSRKLLIPLPTDIRWFRHATRPTLRAL